MRAQPSDENSPVLLLNQSVGVMNGHMHIFGQVKNVENKPLNYVKVLASFYDQSNKFLGSEFNYADPATIGSNAVSTFDIPITSSNIGGKVYTLTIAWQNPDGSSGYSILKPETKKPSIVSKSIPSNPILPQIGKNTSISILSNPTPTQSDVQAFTNQQSAHYPLKPTYLGTIGSEGSTLGKFFSPASIEYSAANNRIYVSDLDNDRIQIFDTKGHFLSTLGASGDSDGQFIHPGDVTIDQNGDVYVSDIGNNRIQKFDSDGKFLTKWGAAGSGSGQFNHPGDIAIDSGDFVYVTDIHNNRIQKFDSDGKFLIKWGSPGSGNGQFNLLTGITIDTSGNIYVSDTGNDRIQKFDSDGQFMKKWGSSGAGVSQLNRPDGITYDTGSGLVFVSDRKNARILVFTDDGKPSSQLDLSKLTHGLKIKPRDVAIDATGKLFVVDKDSSKIHVFSTKPSLQ
ncbi:MAG: 6-bladed beta-propeller [Nitrososphaeraceae archaeon]